MGEPGHRDQVIVHVGSVSAATLSAICQVPTGEAIFRVPVTCAASENI